MTLHVVDGVGLFGFAQVVADEFGFFGRAFTRESGEFAAFGFEESAAAVRAAEFASGVELVDGVFAEEAAECAGGAEAGDDGRAGGEWDEGLGG